MNIMLDNIESDTLFNSADSSYLGEVLTVDTRSEALDAVKLDPAVLEARITIANTRNQRNTFIGDSPPSSEDGAASFPSSFDSFENIVAEQEAALLSLPPGQLDLLLRYADILRSQRNTATKIGCAFCKKNGEAASWYSCHQLRDGRGRVRCPVLRGLHCPRCGATGDRAHTVKYCPQ